MITVKVTGNPSKAFKILKRLVNEEGIFNTLREQKYFTKKLKCAQNQCINNSKTMFYYCLYIDFVRYEILCVTKNFITHKINV